VPDGNIRLRTKGFQTRKLVVYKSFERSYVYRPYARRHILRKKGKYREKCRLGLSRSRGSAQKNIFLRIEYRIRRRDLHGTKRFPVISVYEIFYKGSISVKRAHNFPLSFLNTV